MSDDAPSYIGCVAFKKEDYVQAPIVILQANADANSDPCQMDEWKALLAAVSQLSTCTRIFAMACRTYMKTMMPMEDRLLNNDVLADRYEVELRKGLRPLRQRILQAKSSLLTGRLTFLLEGGFGCGAVAAQGFSKLAP